MLPGDYSLFAEEFKKATTAVGDGKGDESADKGDRNKGAATMAWIMKPVGRSQVRFMLAS